MNSKPKTKNEVSIAPNGEAFPLPKPEDYKKEFNRIQKLVAKNRKEGREIVVVMGVGFVGAVMAGVVADSTKKDVPNPSPLASGPSPKYPKFVIGVQRPSTRSYWKIPYMNRGIAPVEAEDPEVAPLIARCVNEKKTLIATYTDDALSLADVVVVDVQCDYFKETLGDCRQGHAEIKALEDSLKIIGEKINPDCLVLIETTVPPGTTEYVAYPILKKAFERRFAKPDQSTPKNTKLKTLDSRLRGNDKKGDSSSLMFPADARAVGSAAMSPATLKGTRGGGAGGGYSLLSAPSPIASGPSPAEGTPEPLLAHSYERVMPGKEYVASIRDF